MRLKGVSYSKQILQGTGFYCHNHDIRSTKGLFCDFVIGCMPKH